MDKIWINLDRGPLGNNRSCQKLVHIVVSASEVLVISLRFEGHCTDTSLLRLGSANPLAWSEVHFLSQGHREAFISLELFLGSLTLVSWLSSYFLIYLIYFLYEMLLLR